MKLLTVRFEFQIEVDVFGLHTLDPKAAAWLRQGMSDAEDLPGVTVTIEPLADLANPGGLTQVRKRTRGPNKAKPGANGAEAAQGEGEGT